MISAAYQPSWKAARLLHGMSKMALGASLQGLECGNEAVHETHGCMVVCQRSCSTLTARIQATCLMHSLADPSLSSGSKIQLRQPCDA